MIDCARWLLFALVIGSACVLDSSAQRSRGCLGHKFDFSGKYVRVVGDGTHFSFFTRTSEDADFGNMTGMVFNWHGVTQFELRSELGCRPRTPLTGVDFPDVPLQLSDCLCNSSTFTRPVPEQPDVEELGIEATIFNCTNQPGFVITGFISIRDGFTSKRMEPTMKGSEQPYFDYTTPAHSAKLGFNLSDWNWQGEDLSKSYLAIEADIGIYSDGAVTASTTIDTFGANVSSVMEDRTLFLYLDRGVVLDGMPSLPFGLNMTVPFFDLKNGTAGQVIYTPVAAPLCPPFKPEQNHTMRPYRHIWYDPSFTALFNSPPKTSPSSSTSSAAKSKATATILIAVFVPLAAVVVIAVVLLVIFVPSVKHFFQPYSKRHDQQHHGEAGKSQPSGWTKAKTPAGRM